MASTIGRRSLRVPDESDAPDPVRDIVNLATDLQNVAIYNRGTPLPSSGEVVGDLFRLTSDTTDGPNGTLYEWSGSAWIRSGADAPPDGSVTVPKLSTTTLNNFLKLFTSGDHKAKWGNVNIDGGGFGSVTAANRSIAHGMGATPVWAIVWCTTGISTGDVSDPIICSLVSLDATNINIRIRTASGGTINFPGISAYWLAIT